MPSKKAPALRGPDLNNEPIISLAESLSVKTAFSRGLCWIVGDTPLITHAWSEKAKKEMLAKQVKSTKPGREQRKPEDDFVDSLYEIGTDPRTGKLAYGFPSMGVKNAILAVAHKDKGIPRSSVLQALWIDAPIVRTRPALAGAVCDMPLARIFAGEPEIREDMVKIGSGLKKTANLAYRGQFRYWAMRLSVRYNPAVLSPEALVFLISEAGIACGLGEWRNERHGVFGRFHVASLAEEQEWRAFAGNKGPLPEHDQPVFDFSDDDFLEAA
jgi:hypothetical protein